jgi:hypothetical protein
MKGKKSLRLPLRSMMASAELWFFYVYKILRYLGHMQPNHQTLIASNHQNYAEQQGRAMAH